MAEGFDSDWDSSTWMAKVHSHMPVKRPSAFVKEKSKDNIYSMAPFSFLKAHAANSYIL